jgi:hypothetical protein
VAFDHTNFDTPQQSQTPHPIEKILYITLLHWGGGSPSDPLNSPLYPTPLYPCLSPIIFKEVVAKNFLATLGNLLRYMGESLHFHLFSPSPEAKFDENLPLLKSYILSEIDCTRCKKCGHNLTKILQFLGDFVPQTP